VFYCKFTGVGLNTIPVFCGLSYLYMFLIQYILFVFQLDLARKLPVIYQTQTQTST
jgi:hypothetical protein